MKKIIIVIISVIVLMLGTDLFIEFVYKSNNTNYNQQSALNNEINKSEQKKPSNDATTNGINALYSGTKPLPEITTRPPTGVSTVLLKDLQLPPEIKNEFEQRLKLFKSTGSISGGELTHEFSNIDDMKKALKDKNLEKQKAELAIKPINLANILGENYKLIGANTQSKYIPDKGWTGFFQIVENQYSPIMIELSENQLETAAGDGTQRISEFTNEYIDGEPATIEIIKLDKSGNVYNIHWSNNNRLFVLTVKNISRQEALNIAEQITDQFKKMPNEGWKEPYVLDVENNLLHRTYKLK